MNSFRVVNEDKIQSVFPLRVHIEIAQDSTPSSVLRGVWWYALGKMSILMLLFSLESVVMDRHAESDPFTLINDG